MDGSANNRDGSTEHMDGSANNRDGSTEYMDGSANNRDGSTDYTGMVQPATGTALPAKLMDTQPQLYPFVGFLNKISGSSSLL